ncbi:hypothetical protein HK097_009547 [Rhizophlyctis rosea]|uniref:MICOS complex subunit MIC12 n=1 Tax=Rhizophlyctis rosea TaxID=64517 RepID=A0AAD5S8S5_9FUNG|nr:hypothetical protein HK097_009547 [Rhizophlyctis rosea]
MSKFILPLTAGLLLATTSYQVIRTHMEQNTLATKYALRQMQRDLEVNLPAEHQNLSLFTPTDIPPSQQPSLFINPAASFPFRSASIDYKLEEVKTNWNRAIHTLGSKITGQW